MSHPISAISNCFPGLEFDFRTIWRRILVGILLSENSNFVVETDQPELVHLKGTRLLSIDGNSLAVQAQGPVIPDRAPIPLTSAGNPQAVAFMEWSNSLARVFAKQGETVACVFTRDASAVEVLPSDPGVPTIHVDLAIRQLFASPQGGKPEERMAVIAEELVEPGELSQGLCSPWQNDYRECACYYWAASRPDYVNTAPAADGTSRGDNWMQRVRSGTYLPDDRSPGTHLGYDELFSEWEKVLKFVIKGVQEP